MWLKIWHNGYHKQSKYIKKYFKKKKNLYRQKHSSKSSRKGLSPTSLPGFWNHAFLEIFQDIFKDLINQKLTKNKLWFGSLSDKNWSLHPILLKTRQFFLWLGTHYQRNWSTVQCNINIMYNHIYNILFLFKMNAKTTVHIQMHFFFIWNNFLI